MDELIRRGDLLKPDENSDKILIIGGGRTGGKTLAMAEALMKRKIETVPAVDAVILPPVKIGDTAYFIINRQIYEAEICILQWYNSPRGVIDEIRGDVVGGSVSASFSDWGKAVFLTREEAEAAIAKMDGERKDHG